MSSITYWADEEVQQFANINKKCMNRSEVRMWMVLRHSDYNFRRQQTLGNFIADFASLDHKIVVEIDGISHEYKQDYDKEREHYITEHGYKIIRFVGYLPYPDDLIYGYIWDKITELEKGNEMVMVVIME